MTARKKTSRQQRTSTLAPDAAPFGVNMKGLEWQALTSPARQGIANRVRVAEMNVLHAAEAIHGTLSPERLAFGPRLDIRSCARAFEQLAALLERMHELRRARVITHEDVQFARRRS